MPGAERSTQRKLGWPEHLVRDANARKGKIVVLKPALTKGGDTADPADVRQYGMENESFPQQTTADQWFDEAQWESYRRLGLASVAAAEGEI